jgi:hypothetical protein
MHAQKKEYPPLKQLKAGSEFQGSRRQFKSIGFTPKTSTDERTFLWTGVTFLRKKKETLNVHKQV